MPVSIAVNPGELVILRHLVTHFNASYMRMTDVSEPAENARNAVP